MRSFDLKASVAVQACVELTECWYGKSLFKTWSFFNVLV